MQEIIDDLVPLIDSHEDFSVDKIRDSPIDYVLRCSNGVYLNRFIYLNVTKDGEVIGSATDDPRVSFVLEDVGVCDTHCSLTLQKGSRWNYIVQDLQPSKAPGTWIRIRYDYPIMITDNMEIKIGKMILILRSSQEQVDQIQDWLSIIGQEHLIPLLEEQKIATLQELILYDRDQLGQIIGDEKTFNIFLEHLKNMEEEFENYKDQFNVYKIQVIDANTQKQLLQFGWRGCNIGSKTQTYQKPPDILLKSEEIDEWEEEIQVDISIRFLFGQYLIQTCKFDNFSVFYRIKQEQVIMPGDTLQVADVEFDLHRFNTGWAMSEGTRFTMEDSIVIHHELQISKRLNVSFYGVFDGHGGDECVTFVSNNIVDNLREILLKQDDFDIQPNFCAFIKQSMIDTFINTDLEFFQQYQYDKGIFSGCAAVVVLIVGEYLIVANVGDCRAVLCKAGKAINLTLDHKPDNPIEKERIHKSGGTIQGNRIERLAVSRAFGDFSCKRQKHPQGKDLIIVEPDVRMIQIDFSQDEFIVLSSDGLYDSFSTSQNVVDIVRAKLKQNDLMEQDSLSVVKSLVNESVENSIYRRGKSDNVSAILVTLNRGVI